MDYSKIEAGITSIVEAIKESTSESPKVSYAGISELLREQNQDIETSITAFEERSKHNGNGVAESTTDLVSTINGLRDIIGSTFDEDNISSASIADHLSNNIDIDASDIADHLSVDASEIAEYIEIDTSYLAQSIKEELDIEPVDTKELESLIDGLGVDLFKRMDEIEATLKQKVVAEVTAHWGISEDLKGMITDEHQRMVTGRNEGITVLEEKLDTLSEQLRVLPTESQVKEYINEARRELEDRLDGIEGALFPIEQSLQLSGEEVEARPSAPDDDDDDEPIVQFVKCLDHLGIMGSEAMHELRRMTVHLEGMQK